MEDLEYESNDGISIGTAVTLPDGRFAKVTDLYFKGPADDDHYFAQVLTTDEESIQGILVSDLRVGLQR
ncbi:MAG: hypothetical protein K5880_14825 [Hydrogenophaga sp.]|uniref:hypothetical protein n=1 Tax=Hydrogenophaga sp. TaxID=1904254 RepID=UPI00260C4AF3|nr:hypothetical protein [Hydrogenophaga sp.]MCV0439871.1 hypothetical protein [Hydrogenophaga sp.]